MKKQQMQLIILIVILAVLAGGYFVLKQYNKAQAQKPDEAQGEEIVSLTPADIVKFSYDYEDNHYAYEKVDGIWYYAANHDLNLNQSRIETMLSNAVPLTVQETITKVTDLSQYGLNKPSGTITLESQNESYIFNVGDYNSINSIYYICNPSDSTVYVVSAATVNGFHVDVLDIVEEEESTETENTEMENTVMESTEMESTETQSAEILQIEGGTPKPT